MSLDIHEEWAASFRAHQGNSHSRNLLTQFTQSLSESTLHSHCGTSTDPANPAQNSPQNKPFPLSMDISYHHYQNNIKGDMHKSHTRTMGSEMKDLSLYELGTCPTHGHLPRGLRPPPAPWGYDYHTSTAFPNRKKAPPPPSTAPVSSVVQGTPRVLFHVGKTPPFSSLCLPSERATCCSLPVLWFSWVTLCQNG